MYYICRVNFGVGMKRYQIRAKATKIEKSGNVISGLALPYGIAMSEYHPAFTRGALVDYGYTRPLLIEHDVRQIAGDVIKVYEQNDGVYFVAVKNVDEDYTGVSIGAEYWVDEKGKVAALYIHEISLTNTPAYPTYYSVVAHEQNQESQTQKNIESMETIKAQDVNVIMQELEALRERVGELENRLTQLETALMTLTEEVAALRDTTNVAVEASTKTLDAAKEELAKHQAMLNEQVNASLTGIVETLQKLVANLKK